MEVVQVGKEEFIQIVGDAMLNHAICLHEDRKLFIDWIKRLEMEEQIPIWKVPFDDFDDLFWQAFIMGGMFFIAKDLDRADEEAAGEGE